MFSIVCKFFACSFWFVFWYVFVLVSFACFWYFFCGSYVFGSVLCVFAVVFVRIFVYFEKYQKQPQFVRMSKIQLSASNCEPPKPTGKFFDNQRNVVRLPDNHERLLQTTRGPASHPTHINAYQVAISLNISCSFAISRGLRFENAKAKGVFLKNATGEFVFSSCISYVF